MNSKMKVLDYLSKKQMNLKDFGSTLYLAANYVNTKFTKGNYIYVYTYAIIICKRYEAIQDDESFFEDENKFNNYHQFGNWNLIYSDFDLLKGTFYLNIGNKPCVIMKIEKFKNYSNKKEDYRISTKLDCVFNMNQLKSEDADELFNIIQTIEKKNFKELGLLEYYMYIKG